MEALPYGNVLKVKEIKIDHTKSAGGVLFLEETAVENSRRQTYSQGVVMAVDKFLEDQTPIEVGTGVLFNTALAKEVGDGEFIVEVTQIFSTLKTAKKAKKTKKTKKAKSCAKRITYR